MNNNKLILPLIEEKQSKIKRLSAKWLAYGKGTCGANEIMELIRGEIADLDYAVACTTLDDLYRFGEKLKKVVEEKKFHVTVVSKTDELEIPETELTKLSETGDVSKGDNTADKKGKDRIPTVYLILLGPNTTKGEGARSNPEIGKKASEESKEIIDQVLAEYDLVFLCAGMSGGTGGTVSYEAKLAKENETKKGPPLVISIVAKCYSYEGSKKVKAAEEGIKNLLEHSDVVVVVPNDKIESVCSQDGVFDAIRKHNDVLASGIISVVTLLKSKKERSADLSDLRQTFENAGYGLIGRGSCGCSDANAHIEALNNALHSPWLDNYTIRKESWVLLHLEIPEDFSNPNCEKEILKEIQKRTDYTSEIKVAITKLPKGEDFYVTVFAPADVTEDKSEPKIEKTETENTNETKIESANEKVIPSDVSLANNGNDATPQKPKRIAAKVENDTDNTNIFNDIDVPTIIRIRNKSENIPNEVPNEEHMPHIQQFTDNHPRFNGGDSFSVTSFLNEFRD